MNTVLRMMTAIYLMKDNRFLLLYRQGGRVVNNVYTGSAGGHLEKDELTDPRACVLRELREELSLTEEQISNPELRYIALRYTGGEIRQNFYYFAELKEDVGEICSNEGALQWVDFYEAASLEMPFCAKFAIEHYLQIGRYDHRRYRNGAGIRPDGPREVTGKGKTARRCRRIRFLFALRAQIFFCFMTKTKI